MGVHRSRQLAFVTAMGLPAWSAGPSDARDAIAAAAEAGYEGMQVFLPEQARAVLAAGMARPTAISPARTVDDLEALLVLWAGEPLESLTLHLGTGFETIDEGRRLVEATLQRAAHHAIAVHIETHRATLFQDPARSLALVDEFPELRFTADLSHWYTGAEMVYGDLEAKLDALAPIFARCRMIHGRIADPGCIQVAVASDDDAPYIEHFRRMWAAVLTGCAADGGVDHCPFVVELLPSAAHYARTVLRDGVREEEVDRWHQADVLWDIFSNIEEPS